MLEHELLFYQVFKFVGSKGSKDTAVDIRGFAVKFYTTQGNYDMLGLQFPIFVLNDAMKFMDVVHAAKPNQTTDVPQASLLTSLLGLSLVILNQLYGSCFCQ